VAGHIYLSVYSILFKMPSLNPLLLILLTLFTITTASTITLRQTTPSTNCTTYARTANLTIISNNSTFRAAFLQSAPMGVSYAATILDEATLQLPALQFDEQLNSQCGNLTTVAFTEAARNFSQGTVLGLDIIPPVGVAPDSFAMLFSWIFITLMMVGMGGSL
jgi:hypothetical protein